MSFFPVAHDNSEESLYLVDGKVQFRIFRNKGEATWTHRWKLC